MQLKTHNLFLFIKRILFPGLDIGTRKRVKFVKYFRRGDALTLDIGCGNGAFSFAAAKLGNRVVGIDYNEEKLKRCLEFRDYLKIDPGRCDFTVLNVYKILSLQKKFDQIICFETLEHIENDRGVLELISKILKPDGVLHLCVPYLKRKPYYGEIISETEDGNHLRLGYTFKELEEILKKAGFIVTKKDTAVGFLAQKLINLNNWLDVNLFKNFGDRAKDAVHLFNFIFLYFLTILDNFIPTKQLNIYISAQKYPSNLDV